MLINWASPFSQVSYPWSKLFFTIKAKTTERSTTIIQVVLSTVLDMALCATNIPLLDIQSISLQQVSFLQANFCLWGYESFLNNILSHCFINCFIEVKFKKTTSDWWKYGRPILSLHLASLWVLWLNFNY